MAGLADMKMTPAESADASDCCVGMYAEYSYGLRLHLNQVTMAKLGMKELPGAGDTMRIEAIVHVCEVTSEPNDGDPPDERVGLQITEMSIVPAAKRNPSALYPSTAAAVDEAE